MCKINVLTILIYICYKIYFLFSLFTQTTKYFYNDRSTVKLVNLYLEIEVVQVLHPEDLHLWKPLLNRVYGSDKIYTYPTQIFAISE